LLFAAGKGERLRPLTETVAKPALPILDIPLGAWGMHALGDFRPAIVNTSHLSDSVSSALAGYDGVTFFLEQPEPFGTGGTLAALRHEFADTFVCWNSDMLTDLGAQGLMAAHERLGVQATIAVRRTQSRADFFVEGDQVTQLVDRRVEDHAGFQYLGAAVFNKDALSLLPKDRPLGLTLSLLKPLLERGQLAAHVHEGYWIDVGTVDRYLQATLDVLYRRGPLPPTLPPGQVIDVEGGRVYVGRDADVERGSLGPGAIVLARAHVQRGARVENAIVMPAELVGPEELVKETVWFQEHSLKASPDS
jgi:mannose-1-phosphate guanylyltransferase